MNRLKEIDVIRAFVIIVLVMYHAFAPFCGKWEMPTGLTGNSFYYWFAILNYSGMLETFVFISGYVFAYSASKKNTSFTILLKSKFRRLLIPCFCWGILINLYPFNVEKWLELNTWTSIINGFGHFWFLPMLFWVFVLYYVVNKHLSNFRYLNVLLIILAILPYPTIPMHLNNSFYYLLFFHLGKVFFENKTKLLNIKKSNTYIILTTYLLLFILGSLAINSNTLNPENATSLINKALIIEGGTTVRFVYSLFAVLIYYLVFTNISLVLKDNIYSKLQVIAKYSFGIYIFQEIILRQIYYNCGIGNLLGIYSPWVAFISAFVLSLMLSILFSKSRATKFLLGL